MIRCYLSYICLTVAGMTTRKNLALKIRSSSLRDRIIELYFDRMKTNGLDISDVIREEIENSLRHRGIWEQLEKAVIRKAVSDENGREESSS